MKKALITGANKGIGLETAKQLLRQGFYVYLASRNPENGRKAVEELKSQGLANIESIQLDVTSEASVEKAKSEIGQKTDVLDVLVNNAGISGIAQSPSEATIENFKSVFETNLYGAIRATTAFLDLLKASDAARIVNVSSNMGSLTLASDPDYAAYDYKVLAAYSSSKSALNMYTVHLAYELKDTKIKVNAVCPGYTSTDFTNHVGGELEVAGKRISKYALLDENGPTGKFFSEEANPETGEIPW
ncbi:SDR family oxidoreductase [Flavobacterium sp.]|uniref:SDR family oxidoreductase n=1 Tax=Flavobacterium sp. TaxID=239 RepID=UPI0012082374|nr:SDR family oxidoreductase [Flavobacterium sp.]RZJ73002.1 MAG: SDR family oxidoreductase [Flavobacterium sp.]